MDIDKHYLPLLEDLKQGKRVFFSAEKADLESLAQQMYASIESNDLEKLRKILCLVDHCKMPSPYFAQPIYQGLDNIEDEEIVIFLLSCSSKHLLKLAREGDIKIEKRYFTKLGQLMSHNDPEVIEWTLRIIDQLPRVPEALKAAVLKNKPSLLKIGNKHFKAIRQIITMLDKRWKHVPRGPT